MSEIACPACTLTDVLSHPDKWECATCGHEWPKADTPAAAKVVKDANGTPLADGDTVVLINDLKDLVSGPFLDRDFDFGLGRTRGAHPTLGSVVIFV